MLSKILLRIAAVLMFIHGVLHTIGFTSWKTDPNRQDVVKAMMGPKLPFMGANRNIGEFYDGFGYASSIALLLIALTLWIVAGELASRSLAKKLILTLSLILLLWGIDEIIFFFPFAACISLLSCLCCVVAYFGLKKQSA
ncbi:MAG: hypothetical protein JST19_08640 [Bacteroidetes bacterium]|nr:hypothetical protein [Bacteroidota bacterium]